MTRRSKCWRFLAALASGTRWNHRLGPPHPAGSTQARSGVLSGEQRAAVRRVLDDLGRDDVVLVKASRGLALDTVAAALAAADPVGPDDEQGEVNA